MEQWEEIEDVIIMPTVNIYHQNPENFRRLDAINPQLKTYFAERLSCSNRKLAPDEISIRYIEVKGSGMLGNVEVEIKVHHYPERVEQQDEICRDVSAYLEKEVPSVAPVKSWLQLSELGHSW